MLWGLKVSRERMGWGFSHALGTVVVINVVFKVKDGERRLVSFDTAGTSELNASRMAFDLLKGGNRSGERTVAKLARGWHVYYVGNCFV